VTTLPVNLPGLSLPRILVVDGEPAISNVLRVCMGSLGYEVRRARCLSAALGTLRRWTPDLVITSIRKSREAAHELYVNIHEAKVPVLLLCATEDQRRAIEEIGVSADQYLIRPFSIAQVLERLQSVAVGRKNKPQRLPHFTRQCRRPTSPRSA